MSAESVKPLLQIAVGEFLITIISLAKQQIISSLSQGRCFKSAHSTQTDRPKKQRNIRQKWKIPFNERMQERQ
jgi:hypothetical protein